MVRELSTSEIRVESFHRLWEVGVKTLFFHMQLLSEKNAKRSKVKAESEEEKEIICKRLKWRRTRSEGQR